MPGTLFTGAERDVFVSPGQGEIAACTARWSFGVRF